MTHSPIGFGGPSGKSGVHRVPKGMGACLCLMMLATALWFLATARPLYAAPLSPGVQEAARYHGVAFQSLDQRVHSAPPQVLQLLWQRNRAHGVDVRPRAAASEHPLRVPLVSMLRGLPSPVKRLAERYVAAIFLVEDNFGSARVEAVRDEQGNIVGGYLALNLSVLARPANAWITWRENSAFGTNEEPDIRITLQPPESNTVENALQYLFLHELGHIVGMATGVHGFWAAPETLWLTSSSSYIRLSWVPTANAMLSPWKQQYPVLARPAFYRFENSTLPRSEAPAVYSALAQTNLPSLYGSTDPYEDFAESFAIYVHTRLLNRPYQVELQANGATVGRYGSCLQTGRCPQKVRFFEVLLGP